MAIFDGLAKQAFGTIIDVMGDDAVWLSSNTGELVPAKVLYNDPTAPTVIGGDEAYEYKPTHVTVEFYTNAFLGLKKSVDMGVAERINVKGHSFFVREVQTKFDGATYVAYLEPWLED